MKLYIQPIFSNIHPKKSIVKKLGSSEKYFSSIRLFYKIKDVVKTKIISLNDIPSLTRVERSKIFDQIRNIEIKRKNSFYM